MGVTKSLGPARAAMFLRRVLPKHQPTFVAGRLNLRSIRWVWGLSIPKARSSTTCSTMVVDRDPSRGLISMKPARKRQSTGWTMARKNPGACGCPCFFRTSRLRLKRLGTTCLTQSNFQRPYRPAPVSRNSIRPYEMATALMCPWNCGKKLLGFTMAW